MSVRSFADTGYVVHIHKMQQLNVKSMCLYVQPGVVCRLGQGLLPGGCHMLHCVALVTERVVGNACMDYVLNIAARGVISSPVRMCHMHLLLFGLPVIQCPVTGTVIARCVVCLLAVTMH